MRLAAAALAGVGWALLAAMALAGLALSAVALLAAAPVSRAAIASALVDVVDRAIAGRIELGGIEVLPHGGIELRELEVYAPGGRLVLSVGRARAFVELTALRRRVVGVSLELEGPSVLVEEEPGGGVSLGQAFASPGREPSPPDRGPRADGGGGEGGWTFQVARLDVRGGEVWWVDEAGQTRLEATGVDAAALGSWGPERGRAEVRLRAELREPLEAPLAIEAVAERSGAAIRVPVLRAEAGGTSLEAVAEGDLARRSGRAAIARLGVSRAQARALVPEAPPGADLRATGYAEAEGGTATAALRVEPAGGGAEGRGDVAVAATLDAIGRAVGFDVALERLDPSLLVAGAPPGALTLTGRGAVAGRSLDAARARLALTVGPSRLRGGTVSRAEVALRAADGTVELDRLDVAAPALSLTASGRWRRGGAARGTATLDAPDLARAARNVALLAGAEPPGVGGRVHVAAELSGTAAAPVVAASLDAPLLRAGGLRADGLRASIQTAGALRAIEGRAAGRASALWSGARDVAREVVFRAELRGGEGSLSASAGVPGAGRERMSLEAMGRLGPRRESLLLARLALGYPGARWALVRPAAVDLRAPSVDRLELAAGAQRIAISGGLAAGGRLAARAELVRVDLARLPAGILAEEDRVRGALSGTVDASGTRARPVLSADLSLAGGAFRGVEGLALAVGGRYDGAARRAVASVSAARAAGGTLDAAIDLPVPLRGRPAEGVSIRIRAEALPLAEVLATAGADVPADGVLAAEARVTGTAGAPSLSAEASISRGAWKDLDELGATVAVEAAGERLRVSLSASRAGRRVVGADAEAPLELSALLARPGETLRALRDGPVEAGLAVTALDLAELAGRAGLPPGIAGVVDGRAHLSGSRRAPRGAAALDLSGGAWKGWTRVGAHVELGVDAGGLSASGRMSLAGTEALRFRGALGIRPERLARRDELLAAALRVEASVPRLDLAAPAGETMPLAGTIEGRLVAAGTLRAPEVTLEASGEGLAVKGRPLGGARATGRYAGRRADAHLTLRPAAGGTLEAALEVTGDLGLGARTPLRDAPAEATVVANDLDLGFLAAVAPDVIRSAGGKIALDVRARGPLARLSPRGTLRVEGGRVAVLEFGEWTDVAVEATVTDEVIELARLDLRRGRGRLSAKGALRGLRSDEAKLEASVRAEALTITRYAMDVATVDLEASATGSWRPGTLGVEVTVPRGLVRFPKKSPRELQSLERRTDIVVGRRPERERPRAAEPAGASAGPAAPFTFTAHVVAPRNFFVKGESPRIDVELKADVRYELAGGQDYLEGAVEVVRGSVEPIAGRTFGIERGRVQFTGGPPRAALLDFEARYRNPAAVVTVNVGGPLSAPEIRLTSQPPMDEAQIAMLIATGRTELKAGSGAVGTLTGEEAGKAALGAIATQAFRNLVADKLPLDTVAIDTGALRAGKYVTDRIYVGYTRRFDARPELGENEDEIRVEYQISPRWTFESRYGNAQSGGASLVWSREY